MARDLRVKSNERGVCIPALVVLAWFTFRRSGPGSTDPVPEPDGDAKTSSPDPA